MPLPFMDQLLERISGHLFYCFLDGYSDNFQIEIAVEDQEKTTHLAHMPIGGCPLACVMPLPHSSDACLVSSAIWWSALWRLTWMMLHFMEGALKNA